MTQQPATSDPATLLKKKKKKDRLRAAWISFTGRILAQMVGAIATVTLGVLVLHKAQAGSHTTAGTAAPVELAGQATPAAVDRTPNQSGIAVLSFQNYSGDPRQDAFADALTEALISNLAQIDTWHVVSRTSSSQYKGQRRPLPDIARELGAAYVIEGSVTRANGRLRVVAQLIDARTDQHLWARSYDRALRDPLAVQMNVAAAITGDVRSALDPKRLQPRLLAGPPAEIPAVAEDAASTR
jgi:TolB-like protein